MSKTNGSLTFTRSIQAPIELVYRAFAKASGLQEWFADLVQADAREGGRFYAYWNSGFYASGHFLSAVKDKSVAFTWHALGEPAESRVDVTLEAQDQSTDLTLVHSGLGDSETWTAARENIEREWQSGLGNLQSVLETGTDKRLYDRPMLGFFIGGIVDANLKRRLGLPVDSGVHVEGVVDGMGAQRSGLQAEDVIYKLDGREITEFDNLRQALTGRKGGEIIEAVIYRGGQPHTLKVELSKRPVPKFPAEPKEFSVHLSGVYEELLTALAANLTEATEQEASFNPGPGEWNAKETLAHLIAGFRYNQISWASQVDDLPAPNYPDESPLIKALAAEHTAQELLDQVRSNIQVYLRIIAGLPEGFSRRKASYFSMAAGIEDSERSHFQQHGDQIKAALQAGRQAGQTSG